MAHLDYLGANDPDTVASTQLAHDLWLLIMSQTDRVNIAITRPDARFVGRLDVRARERVRVNAGVRLRVNAG